MKIRMGWEELRDRVAGKGLALQYVEHYAAAGRYFVFAVEGPVIYVTDIWEAGGVPDGYDGDADADRVDFETNYKGGANGAIVQKVEIVT